MTTLPFCGIFRNVFELIARNADVTIHRDRKQQLLCFSGSRVTSESIPSMNC